MTHSGVRALHLVYPDLPPTENKIRMIRWGRVGKSKKPKPIGMTYTKEADRYVLDFREFVKEHHFIDVQKFRRHHKPWSTYTLRLLFFFPAELILNKSWLAKGKKKAKTPYKKMDVGNRRKLLEDCFSQSIDVDDSLNFNVELTKFVSDEPRVELILVEEDPEFFGIPLEYLQED